MNTRLQVEHPVTELVTGIDLVREQIRVAAGEELSLPLSEVTFADMLSSAVSAEDPDNNFLPSPGIIRRLRIPQGPGVRDDGGVYEGSEVSIYYDPMISKFATYGRDRNEAIDRMRHALMEYEIDGIKTTIPFFRQVMEDSEFIEGKLDTGFIERFNERKSPQKVSEIELDMAIIASALAQEKKKNVVQQAVSNGPRKISNWARSGRFAQFNRS